MSSSMLVKRAALLGAIRAFFAGRQILEVEVPVLGARSITDPYLQPIVCESHQRRYFLQTSPEYFMKRLLAGGAPSIYYLGKAFREDESGRRHNPEFTILEWYRLGFDDMQLMDELGELLASLKPGVKLRKVSYEALFQQHFYCDPHLANAAQLAVIAEQRINLCLDGVDIHDKNLWLDLLFSHIIEPDLQEATLVYDYPVSQCALAKIMDNEKGKPVAKRFELFWQGIELANAYWELSDADLQRQRFADDIKVREAADMNVPQQDEKFLAAIDAGLPECAGIALGVDRLFMCLESLSSIRQALTFSDDDL